MPNAIFFGSIGTIADTSELQRKAFNQAFKQHNLNWEWSQEIYRSLLESSGGQKRIEDYARSLGACVDAAAIHQTKSELFQTFLADSTLEPRLGVTDVLKKAKANDMALALVTTTSQKNVFSVLDALGNRVSAGDFDMVITADDVSMKKPAKDAYCYALEQLDQPAGSCVAIEDNIGGVAAAAAANIVCLAFPNQNTVHHDFKAAERSVDSLDFESMRSLLTTQKL